MKLIEYDQASAEVRAVYDDIMQTRQVDWINNFWKAIAIDPLTKQLLYLAVSIANGCRYCIYSHTAAARGEGMTDQVLAELVAIVGMASETNRLAEGYQVPVDEVFIPVPDQ